MTPALSVIVATYNGAATIGLQLEALSRQRDAPPFEVIVVDNGSSDGVGEVALAWADRLDLRVHRADAEQGVSYARSEGIAQARADKLAFCDDDDCVGAGWVAAAVRALDEQPLVTGSVTELAAAEFTSVDDLWARVPSPDAYRPPAQEDLDPDYPILMGGDCAMTAAMARELGGFDQGFFPGAEDNDLALRYQATGRRLLKCSSMVVVARARATESGLARRSYQAGRMHMRLCAVHDLWRVSPHLRNPHWFIDLFRALAAWARARLTGGDTRGAASRVGLRWGQLVGFVRYRVLRRR